MVCPYTSSHACSSLLSPVYRIGKAFMIKETCSLSYLYLDQDGKEGERSSNRIEGRSPEWILLDGTPATCSNVAIHNLFVRSASLLLFLV